MSLTARERAFLAELVAAFPGSRWEGPDPLASGEQLDLLGGGPGDDDTYHPDWHRPRSRELPPEARELRDRLRRESHA